MNFRLLLLFSYFVLLKGKFVPTDCNQTLCDGVTVTTSFGYYFNSKGNFGCPSGGRLFYSNGTELENDETVCLRSGQWLGQDGLQCWKAPNVTLQDNSSRCAVVGRSLELTCLYNDTLPKGIMTMFIIGNGKTFSISLKKQHNGSKVFCQARTPFTQKYKRTGRSDAITIHVFSKPGNVRTTVDTSDDVIISDITIFLDLFQNISLHCKSNVDSATCEWKFNNIILSSSCDTNQYFNQSGFVTCDVSNCAGSQESKRMQIIVVESRNATIKQLSPAIEGQTVTLLCKIDYHKELNTMFRWITTSNIIVSNGSKLALQNITRFKNGRFICSTTDVFQNSTANVDIVVLYKPYDALVIPQASVDIIHTGSRVLLNGNQDVTLYCESEAKPEANCSIQFGNKNFGLCNITEHISSHRSVYCSAVNAHGFDNSQPLELIVVKENEKIPDIRHDFNNKEQFKVGDDLTLKCSVLYQNELKTSFEWITPLNDREVKRNTSILELNNLTRFDWGNYTCLINNNFGTAHSTEFVDVLFTAVTESGNVVNCTHDDVQLGRCVFHFLSNPSVDNWVLTANGEKVDCPSCNISFHGGSTLQTFYLNLISTHDQKFELTLKSSIFPHESLTAYMYITGADQISPGTGEQTVIIVASVIGCIVLVSLVIGAILFCFRRNFTPKQSDTNNTNKAESHQKHATAEMTEKNEMEKSETEERINPVYGSSISYATFDRYTTQENSEKEERTNPLYYDSRELLSFTSDTYEAVDKTKEVSLWQKDSQRKCWAVNEKCWEENVGPMYGENQRFLEQKDKNPHQ